MRSTIEVEDFGFQGLRDTGAHRARSTWIEFNRRARLPLDPGNQWDPEHEPRGPRAPARGLCAARARHHERLGAEQPVPRAARRASKPKKRRNMSPYMATAARSPPGWARGSNSPTSFEFQELGLSTIECLFRIYFLFEASDRRIVESPRDWKSPRPRVASGNSSSAVPCHLAQSLATPKMAASFEMAEEEIEAPRSTGAEAAVTPDSSYRSIERATEDDETVGGMFWFATTHRIGSCCGLCGVNALFIIVTLVLGGLGLQPMSTDKLGEVGLTLIEDRYQRRANAYAKGALEANFDLVTARCPRSVAADPIILILPDDAGVL